MRTITLNGTPAAKYLDGDGYGVLVVKSNLPQLLLYSPDKNVPFKGVLARANFTTINELDIIINSTDVYSGFVENNRFNVQEILSFDLKFSEILKTARKSMNLTQSKLSELLEIPQRTIEDWECDLRHPPMWVVKLLIFKLKSKEAD